MKPFSIDPVIIDSYISAGDIATAAERHFADQIGYARDDLRELEREMVRKRRDTGSDNPGDLVRLPMLQDKLARLQAQAAEGYERRMDDVFFGRLAREASKPAGLVL